MWWKSLASLARARHRPHHAVPQAEEVPLSSGSRDERELAIQIVGAGIEPPDYDLLVGLAADLVHTFGIGCQIEDEWLDLRFAYDADRDQYYSTAVLERLASTEPAHRVLAVCPVD